MITFEPPRTLVDVPGAGLSKAGLARFLSRAREAVGLEGEVHVLLADDATLRRLNRAFRVKNKATDVLSFPASSDAAFFCEQEGPMPAGDLAISLDTAARQAKRFGHTLRDEVRVLLLHGLLHLAGFDHESDSGEMAARETELRQELKLPTSLIARVAGKPGPEKRRTTEILSVAQNDALRGVARKGTAKGVVQTGCKRNVGRGRAGA
jgi:probable rRNA maturation factor